MVSERRKFSTGAVYYNFHCLRKSLAQKLFKFAYAKKVLQFVRRYHEKPSNRNSFFVKENVIFTFSAILYLLVAYGRPKDLLLFRMFTKSIPHFRPIHCGRQTTLIIWHSYSFVKRRLKTRPSRFLTVGNEKSIAVQKSKEEVLPFMLELVQYMLGFLSNSK